MILELILAVYTLGAVLFFIALLRDKYVELNKVILLVYLVASVIWPISGLIYILDAYKD
jgi:hypothetical protein